MPGSPRSRRAPGADLAANPLQPVRLAMRKRRTATHGKTGRVGAVEGVVAGDPDAVAAARRQTTHRRFPRKPRRVDVRAKKVVVPKQLVHDDHDSKKFR